MLVDEADITITAGHGGTGKVSFGRRLKSGPDGGNGGRGGDIYINVTSDLKALNQFSKNKDIKAEDGYPGGSNRLSGKDGKDTTITMPVGTEIINMETGQVIELVDVNQNILICKGGLGGKGNWEFRSSTNTTPRYAQPGLAGEEKSLKLELKFLAEYGLIGLPNAGKSSLLNELTNAKAEVGAYPFTTLEANLGVMKEKIIADIPGLIEGAAEGKGLGTRFLKHIEKVKMLLHCIAADSINVVKDYETVNIELEKFSKELMSKKRLILLTKTDLVDEKTVKEQVAKLKKLKHPIIGVSIHDWESIQALEKKL